VVSSVSPGVVGDWCWVRSSLTWASSEPISSIMDDTPLEMEQFALTSSIRCSFDGLIFGSGGV
jgi:hypothetical protein